MTDKDIAVKFSEVSGKIATLDRHEKEFKDRLSGIELGMIDVKTTLSIILSKVDKLPERVHAIELEKAENRYLNSVVKPFFIFFIGMVCSFVFNNIIFAQKEEKDKPRTEVRK
jgi:hypothetical protein